jgi:hypothetical protein
MRKIGLEDGIGLAGLVLIGVGIGMISIPAMLVTEGALLLLLAVIGALRR